MSNGNTTITAQTILGETRRWYLQVPLKVGEGFDERFQPTGFPNLGPALYRATSHTKQKDGTIAENVIDYLLAETPQSLANWFEFVCLDPANPCRYNANCAGIPFIVVRENDSDLTSSLTEPHRIASDEILEKANVGSTPFKEVLGPLLGADKQKPVHLPRVAKRLFYLDPACLLHGVFLEKLDGRIRFVRLLSASITAKHPQTVTSGGVMRGYVTASGKESSIPYSRQDFTAPEIILHIVFHVDSLKALGLDNQENAFLANFALYKISKLLNGFPRLRTACVLDCEIPAGVPADNSTGLMAAAAVAFTAERRTAVYGNQSPAGFTFPDAYKPNRTTRGFDPITVDRATVAPTPTPPPAAPQPPVTPNS